MYSTQGPSLEAPEGSANTLLFYCTHSFIRWCSSAVLLDCRYTLFMVPLQFLPHSNILFRARMMDFFCLFLSINSFSGSRLYSVETSFLWMYLSQSLFFDLWTFKRCSFCSCSPCWLLFLLDLSTVYLFWFLLNPNRFPARILHASLGQPDCAMSAQLAQNAYPSTLPHECTLPHLTFGSIFFQFNTRPVTVRPVWPVHDHAPKMQFLFLQGVSH